MPLSDVVGSGDSAAPEHIGLTAAKAGVVLGLTVTGKLLAALVPHPLVAVTVILPPAFPDVTVIDVDDCPAVMVQSAGTVQVYEVAVGTALML
jgi:hypothetical protein